MNKKVSKSFRKYFFSAGLLSAFLLLFAVHIGIQKTSSNEFCASCHVHPQATDSWKSSSHYDNRTGVIVNCVDCHLPPGGLAYYTEKAETGIRDVYGWLFKDTEKIDWENKSRIENAVHFTYDTSCIHCHQNLFPMTLTTKGGDAHLYYKQKSDQLRCINCHLHVGHYDPDAEKVDFEFAEQEVEIIYNRPAKVEKFENFTEFIPGTGVKFDMIAIPGGEFTLGSPPDEPYRKADEGPSKTVKISSFWMAKYEVTWREFWVWYYATKADGRTDTQILTGSQSELDAVTGPTPPYGNPEQGWGRGDRPAITMTYFAALRYCKWLSEISGKNYRLPTEAEWEYACRGGSQTPYFFEGNPKKYTEKRWMNRLFGIDTTTIHTFVIYSKNSQAKTQAPDAVKPNPFGLYNMLGNVREFCADWYAPDAYKNYPAGQVITDPPGPATGTEHVVRGGSYKSDAIDVRCAARDYTRHDRWLMTDPQIPKSLWWYSDVMDVGFRVVCDNIEK
ncbi:SUMF1/EgtB/PvdO family nonheme iron enzyme [candidate division KSB1 bacterium]|nr:SUMF1/EgtB/PvdO family nonheme iron enzyme [candidate division KSB1 bacterium]